MHLLIKVTDIKHNVVNYRTSTSVLFNLTLDLKAVYL
jgi:hypothetical protein